ncbi:hypothetical protein T265_06825 [Opisthorchis viverrini]|uniref:Uncharacterized protein n=1 Tax=Opisthorchis viverrini TaxID=6198 RepID=A0A075AD20_OPIVI|nr:hypothetical protein T265_06825 [Opisthorchis viverrini]KER25794.1 hypothetical protein T265_06825 [Opisthorchis viverrini]
MYTIIDSLRLSGTVSFTQAGQALSEESTAILEESMWKVVRTNGRTLMRLKAAPHLRSTFFLKAKFLDWKIRNRECDGELEAERKQIDEEQTDMQGDEKEEHFQSQVVPDEDDDEEKEELMNLIYEDAHQLISAIVEKAEQNLATFQRWSLSNLAVPQPSGTLRMAWQLGTEGVLYYYYYIIIIVGCDRAFRRLKSLQFEAPPSQLVNS